MSEHFRDDPKPPTNTVSWTVNWDENYITLGTNINADCYMELSDADYRKVVRMVDQVRKVEKLLTAHLPMAKWKTGSKPQFPFGFGIIDQELG